MLEPSVRLFVSSATQMVVDFREFFWECTCSASTLLVGCQEEHPVCNILSDEVPAWLSAWNEVQMICMWSS